MGRDAVWRCTSVGGWSLHRECGIAVMMVESRGLQVQLEMRSPRVCLKAKTWAGVQFGASLVYNIQLTRIVPVEDTIHSV